MDDTASLIPFFDDLDDRQQKVLNELLASDKALMREMREWQVVRTEIRMRLEEHVPDRSLLVLYALVDMGRQGLLEAHEIERVAASRTALDRALEAHPALHDVVADIQASVAAFDQTWPNRSVIRRSPSAVLPDRRPRPRVHARPVARLAWRISAAVAALFFVGALAVLWQRDAGLRTIENKADVVRGITLSDGSTVRLIGTSTLTVPKNGFADGMRSVDFAGQGYFEIVAGAAPFVIETGNAFTTVYGTAFGLRAGLRETEVTLTTGRVALAQKATPDASVALNAGEYSRVTGLQQPTVPVDVSLPDELSWAALFVFRDTPLREIAARLSAHYLVQIGIDEGLAAELVSGTFPHEQPLREILETVCVAVGASLEESAVDRYFISVPHL